MSTTIPPRFPYGWFVFGSVHLPDLYTLSLSSVPMELSPFVSGLNYYLSHFRSVSVIPLVSDVSIV